MECFYSNKKCHNQIYSRYTAHNIYRDKSDKRITHTVVNRFGLNWNPRYSNWIDSGFPAQKCTVFFWPGFVPLNLDGKDTHTHTKWSNNNPYVSVASRVGPDSQFSRSLSLPSLFALFVFISGELQPCDQTPKPLSINPRKWKNGEQKAVLCRKHGKKW